MGIFIENCDYDDIRKGNHKIKDGNSVLIQIVDPDMDFPTPKFEFKKVYQFKFLDIEEKDVLNNPSWASKAINKQQEEEIVNALKDAYGSKHNVVVHCVAGVCRSGAVTEVGVMMGFGDTGKYRAPNLKVKHGLMKVLGWTYDSDEPKENDWRVITNNMKW